MVTRKEPPIQFNQEPEVYTPQNVMYWSHHAKELKGSQVTKARKFVEADCIEYDKENKLFLCLPLPGYNTRTYTMFKNKTGLWECNCQGWHTKAKDGHLTDGCNCSHVLALFFCFKIGRFRK